MKLLIVNTDDNNDPEYMKTQLESKFPELTIHAAVGEAEVGDFIEEAEILLTFRVSDGLLKRASKLQWIQFMGTGVDYILASPSLKPEVILTSARGIHAPQMTELAFLLMLCLTRNYRRVSHNQDEKMWERWPQPLLYNKSVGILGTGVIGRDLARKCKVFDMTVYGISRTRRENPYIDFAYGPDDLIRVMQSVDYVVNILPNTSLTRNMIGKEALSAMKPTAYFINIGRGETVEEEALMRVLKQKKIAGAGLDVYHTEPLPQDSPLWDMDNVIVVPHLGGMSDIYLEQMLPIFEENLRRYLQGERHDLLNFIER